MGVGGRQCYYIAIPSLRIAAFLIRMYFPPEYSVIANNTCRVLSGDVDNDIYSVSCAVVSIERYGLLKNGYVATCHGYVVTSALCFI